MFFKKGREVNMKYDKIFEEVKAIPIAEIFVDMGFDLVEPISSGYRILNPFTKATKPGNFSISTINNIFNDWTSTNRKGDAIKFVSLYENITYFEAAFKLALKYGIITEDFYKSVFNGKSIDDIKDIKKYETKHCKIERTESHIANADTLDKVYKIFMKFCPLSNKHKEYLHNNRKMDDETIKKYGFFTMPKRAILKGFLVEIEKEFGSQEVLGTIPGFFKRDGEKSFTFSFSKESSGIGIPITDYLDRVVGIQIRKDFMKEADYSRYTWFSSAFAMSSLNKKNLECGTSSGSPIAVCYPDNLKSSAIFITEGKFKAIEIAKNFNSIAISVQGVGTWKNVSEVIEKISERIEITPKNIYPAFDADMASNISVYMQLKAMTDNILSKFRVSINYVNWDISLGKGIDDMLLDGHKDKIKLISKETYDYSYQNYLDRIIANEKNVERVEDISKNFTSEEILELYNKYFKLEKKPN